MATKEGVVITISGDSKDFDKAMANASKSVSAFGNAAKEPAAVFDIFSGKVKAFDSIAGTSFGNAAESVSGLGARLGTAGIALGAVAGAAAGIFAAFKFAEIGEELEKQKKQFDTLAKSAGIVGDSLIAGLEKSAGGLVDTDDLIKIANGSILKLGQSAQSLPQLFDLAQKSVKVFGGDAKQNLELISNSIGNLQTKQLKQIGINVDAEKTFKDYAAGLGLTAAQLNETQKKQALLNAVLETGDKRFKDISTGVADETIANGLKKVGVGFDSIKDAIASIVSSSIGGAFATFLNSVGTELDTIAKVLTNLQGRPETFATELEKVGAQLEALELARPWLSIEEYTKRLEELKAKQEEVSAASVIKKGKDEATEVDQSVIDAKAATDQRILELEAEKNAAILQSDRDLALQKLEIDGASFEEISNAKIAAQTAKNNEELQLTIAKNQAIKNEDEKLAANSLAIAKNQAANKKVLLDQEAANKAAQGKSLVQIESQIFEAGLNFASQSAEATKAINVAQAIRNTYLGATKSISEYPFPFNVAAAAATVALGLSQVAKITAANDGALVTGGQFGVDSNPFLLSKGEIVAPAKSFDEVVEGTARARGFVKADDAGVEDAATQQINITIQGDMIGDETYINKLCDQIREAVDFRDARLS